MTRGYKLILLAGLMLLSLLAGQGLLVPPTYAQTAPPPGVVWGWGDGSYGDLCNGTNSQKTRPADLNLTGVKQVVGAFHSTIFIKDDGTVWTCGLNEAGQLGNGTFTDSQVPVKVSNLTQIKAVAGGVNGEHVLALRNDGTVWAWGGNSYGELGDGTTTNRNTPVQVTGLSQVTAIAVSNNNSYALKSDGTVWAWGLVYYLGTGTIGDSHVPIQVTTLSNITALAAGSFHVLALKSDGTVWSWGSNNQQQLGYDSSSPKGPAQVPGLSGVKAVAAGSAFSVVLKIDGTVWSWGQNDRGQLGLGSVFNSTKTPQQAQGNLASVASISAGADHTLALKTDGTVWAWGYNAFGQLGNNTNTNSSLPLQIQGIQNVRTIVSGGAHSLVILPLSVNLSLDTTSFTFADQNAFTKSPVQRLTITNPATSTTALKINQVALAGNDPSDFSYSYSPGFPVTIPVGSSTQIGLYFQPTGRDQRTAQFSIYSNASTTHVTVDLSGNGVYTSEITLSPVSGSATIGNAYTFTAIVKENNQPANGKGVLFNVQSGPNSYTTDTRYTDQNGVATFTYTGNQPGTDTVVATYVDSTGDTQTSNTASVDWQELNHTPVPSAMGPYTVVEGGSVQLTGWGYDEDGDPLTYTWNLKYDQGSFDTPGQNVTYTATDGPYIQTVIVQVCDNKGACGISTASVTITSANPTATFSASSQSVNEGGSVTLSLTNPYDPSPVDTKAGFTLAYDCGQGQGYTASNVCSFADNGTYTVKGKISDKDGGFSEYSTIVKVNNVNPSASFSVSNQIIDQGNSVTLNLNNPSDPSSADTNAGLTLTYDCGLGFGYSSDNVCSYSNEGIYTVKGKIKDKDGGYSEYSTTIYVNNPDNPIA
ncbi:MAG TPA: hypothetical protein VH186_09835 [Chloroflexia bacterium]|nr:hypothetical protein [Chloroflexia bacterium]